MEWIAIVSAALGSSVLVKVLDIISDIIKKKSSKNDINRRADQMLLLKNLRDDARIYLKNDCISAEQLKSYMELYAIYKQLGGNGYADRIYKEVCDLPISEEEV